MIPVAPSGCPPATFTQLKLPGGRGLSSFSNNPPFLVEEGFHRFQTIHLSWWKRTLVTFKQVLSDRIGPRQSSPNPALLVNQDFHHFQSTLNISSDPSTLSNDLLLIEEDFHNP